MTYWLCSRGKLLDGADEKLALQAIHRVAKLSEDKARAVFLSGKPVRIKQVNSREALEKIVVFLRRAGVDVFIHQQSDEAEASSKPVAERDAAKENKPAPSAAVSEEKSNTDAPAEPTTEAVTTKEPSKPKKRLLAITAVVIALLAGVGGYGWYWLYASESERVAHAENALADGKMAAIAYVDVSKAVMLQEYFWGDVDPQALPLPEAKAGMIKHLFENPAQFKKNLNALFFSIHAHGHRESPEPGLSLLLEGTFNIQQVLPALKQNFDVTPMGDDRWKLVELRIVKGVDKNQPTVICKNPDQKNSASGKTRPPTEHVMFASDQWILISSREETAATIWKRLQDGAAAAQPLSDWHAYRAGKLAALMVITPQDAAKSIRGTAGMMAQGATQKAPDVKGLALGASVSLPASITLNGTLFSENSVWNREMANKGNAKLDEIKTNSMAVSPTIEKVAQRITFDTHNNLVSADIVFDSELLGEMENIASEVMGNLFSPSISMNDGSPDEERIDNYPADYSAYAGMQGLPDIQIKAHETPPMYLDGAYAVSLKRLKLSENGILKLSVAGMLGMPASRQMASTNIEKIAFQITDLMDKDGQSLLRDEVCGVDYPVFGNKHHEPVTQFSAFDGKATLNKELRLNEGVQLSDLYRMTGWFDIRLPTQVSHFSLPAQPGQVVEHNGVRVYIVSVDGGKIAYQVSGEFERLLEVRGLNASGQPLSGGWSSNIGGKGRVTKALKGEVKRIEVYIADDFIRKEKAFDISDILARSSVAKETKSRPFEIMPEKIDIARWNNYAKLDFNGVTFSEKDWWAMNPRTPVSKGMTFSAAKGYIFHAPDSWNTSPQLGLYFPALTELHAVLSAVSTTVEIPSPVYSQPIYHRVNYPYRSDTQLLSIKREHKGMKISTQTLPLGAKVEKGEKLTRVKGHVVVRIPEQVTRIKIPVRDLWAGMEVKGVKVSLQDVSWNMFPGYSLKIEGAIDRLVNLYGLPKEDGRIAGYPINFQSDGYWTMTLPMNKGIEQVELIVAEKQKIVKMPFDVKPQYAE